MRGSEVNIAQAHSIGLYEVRAQPLLGGRTTGDTPRASKGLIFDGRCVGQQFLENGGSASS